MFFKLALLAILGTMVAAQSYPWIAPSSIDRERRSELCHVLCH
jgi:hypothetical protein